MFNESQIKRDIRKSETAYLALVQSVNDKDTSKSLNKYAIVDEYKDVFPDDLPSGLPPARVIDHKIEYFLSKHQLSLYFMLHLVNILEL